MSENIFKELIEKSEYIKDLEELNQKHDVDLVYKTTNAFANQLNSDYGEDLEEYDSDSEEDHDYDFDFNVKKAHYLQEQILTLVSELKLEDKEAAEILANLAASYA